MAHAASTADGVLKLCSDFQATAWACAETEGGTIRSSLCAPSLHENELVQQISEMLRQLEEAQALAHLERERRALWCGRTAVIQSAYRLLEAYEDAQLPSHEAELYEMLGIVCALLSHMLDESAQRKSPKKTMFVAASPGNQDCAQAMRLPYFALKRRSQSFRGPQEYLIGDPWESCEDIAREDLIEWFADSLTLANSKLKEFGHAGNLQASCMKRDEWNTIVSDGVRFQMNSENLFDRWRWKDHDCTVGSFGTASTQSSIGAQLSTSRSDATSVQFSSSRSSESSQSLHHFRTTGGTYTPTIPGQFFMRPAEFDIARLEATEGFCSSSPVQWPFPRNVQQRRHPSQAWCPRAQHLSAVSDV